MFQNASVQYRPMQPGSLSHPKTFPFGSTRTTAFRTSRTKGIFLDRLEISTLKGIVNFPKVVFDFDGFTKSRVWSIYAIPK
jgi:hypothetical protein